MQTIQYKNFIFTPNQKLLDVGCGQGRHSFGAYMHTDIEVVGVDMGFQDVLQAKQNFNQFNEKNDSLVVVIGRSRGLLSGDDRLCGRSSNRCQCWS